jgi:hypothetical protein
MGDARIEDEIVVDAAPEGCQMGLPRPAAAVGRVLARTGDLRRRLVVDRRGHATMELYESKPLVCPAPLDASERGLGCVVFAMRLRIFQADAFASRRFTGDPAAVMLMDAFLADTVLQAIARENNLAETAFLVPDGRDVDRVSLSG